MKARCTSGAYDHLPAGMRHLPAIQRTALTHVSAGAVWCTQAEVEAHSLPVVSGHTSPSALKPNAMQPLHSSA